MTNRAIRRWYLQQVDRIKQLNRDWKSQGLSAEQRARRAWEIRHSARLEARRMMTDPEEVELLRIRDPVKYGNPDGPTFAQLVERLTGRLSGDALYEEIVHEAGRTSHETAEGQGEIVR